MYTDKKEPYISFPFEEKTKNYLLCYVPAEFLNYITLVFTKVNISNRCGEKIKFYGCLL